MADETTFVMVKPDGVQRGIFAEILSRFEKKGLQCVALKMIRVERELAEEHYSIHKGKPFYDELINFICSGPSVASVWRGRNAVAVVRKLVGATSPAEAQPGTIRGDFVIDTGTNVVHASDAPDTAEREISLFFSSGEIIDYPLTLAQWLGESP